MPNLYSSHAGGNNMQNLPIVFGYNLDGLGNSSVPLAFCQHWNELGNPSLLYAPSTSQDISFSWLRPALGSLSRKLIYRLGKPHTPAKIVEQLCFKKEANSEHVYLWAGLSLDIFKRFHNQGTKIIIERINCHQATAKSILDNGYSDLGLAVDHTITDESIRLENKKLSLADGIFCPNPLVYTSLVDNGVPEYKLLPTSYGWSPERFPNLISEPRKNTKPTFLFVGTMCVRKGVPLLLQAWEKADINAHLIFCGSMDSTIEQAYGDYFQRDDITHIPFTRNIGDYYNLADAFVFPTLEEGGPMVTYEAMAHGVVPLVSEMGAGAIVNNRKNGLILSHNIDAWATALRAVTENIPKRVRLGRSARQDALQFNWEKVAARRASLLKNHFPSLWRTV